MSQEQYNTLLSNLLREKCALTKLRVELERRKGKLYRSVKDQKLHKERSAIEDLVTTLRVELASVPILNFRLKGMRSRLGSQEIRVRKREFIEVLPIKEQS